MKLQVSFDNGLLPDKYGKYATASEIKNGEPIISFPIDFSDLPKETKSIALTLTDPDSIPVCGFEWIHWTVANIPASMLSLPESFSQIATDPVVQGKNSSASPLLSGKDDPSTKVGYNGPTPPDKTHQYVLKAYALDSELDIKAGFWMNELLHKITGHVLDSATLNVPSRA